MGATLIVHLSILGFALFNYDTGCEVAPKGPAIDPDAIVIEAALAYKWSAPKRLPQKEKKEMLAPPDAPKVAPEDTPPPPPKEEPPKEEKPPPPPDEIDPKSVLEKNRPQDPDLGKTGSDEPEEQGSEEGSEWGTEIDPTGDPYLAELSGRIKAVWNHPSLDQVGGSVLGCVKLSPDGRIVKRELRDRSPNDTLNRSVTLALKNASDMDKPVPDHLLKLLTGDNACFRFNPEE
jgi:hypothetical protein